MRWLLPIFLFISCAQRIKVPITRMVSPEAIGRGFEMEYRDMGFSQGLLNFEGSRTDNALNLSTVRDRELYMGLGVSPNVDIFYRVPDQSVAIFGVKVQVMGQPSKTRNAGHKLAFALGMGANRDSFEGTYDVKLKADATEFSVIHGYRFSPLILVYDGLTYSSYEFSGKVENANSSFSDDEFDYKASSTWGAHAGVEFGGETFKLKLEYAAQRIDWSQTDPEILSTYGFSLGITF